MAPEKLVIDSYVSPRGSRPIKAKNKSPIQKSKGSSEKPKRDNPTHPNNIKGTEMVESSAGEKNLAADLAERDLSLDNDGCVGDRLGILSENSRLLESSFGELLSISEREADQRERTFRSSRSPPRKQGSTLRKENNSVHGLSSSPQLAPEARLHELFPDRMEYDRETVSHALRDGLGARAAVGPVALERTSGSPIENRKENELDNRRENSPGSHDKVGTSPSRPFCEPGEEEAAPGPEHYIPGGRILHGLERITDFRS